MRAVFADARRGHPGLYWSTVALAALAVVTVVLAVVDQRTLLGAPLWFKPLKFSISFLLYCGALTWMLARLPGRGMRAVGWVIVTGVVLEMVIIVGQSFRGVRSHFNEDSAFNLALFTIMGATVVVIWLATVAIALRFLRAPSADRATTSAVRLGLLVGLVGMSVGFLLSMNGGHAVGVPDGGPGLPFVNWSTTGGDLRIGHFVGMHALQVLPLLAAGLAGVGGRLDEIARTHIVRAVAAGYGGFVALLTWQALRAQPLLAPDALTLVAFAIVAIGTGTALGVVLRAAARRSSSRSASVTV